MNTRSAKKIAKKRHEYMEGYLEQFLAEWNGEK
ncbi:MAG: phosphohydrolase, partial [Candidatus Paceibacterota bacterium]